MVTVDLHPRRDATSMNELGLDTRASGKIRAHASDTSEAGVANSRADYEAKVCLRAAMSSYTAGWLR
eukprot:4853681-Amphidinium_carterae.2